MREIEQNLCMKVLRFIFLTVHAPMRPPHGLPQEESQAFANAWLIPAQFALREGILPEAPLLTLLESPTRAKASEMAVGLWSSQQLICERLGLLGIDARGLPPLTGRALEGFFLPTGRFWMGAYCPCDSLSQSQDSMGKALGALFSHPPRKSRAIPFPWLGEFSRSGAWALGANQSFGAHADLMGPPSTRE